MAVNQELMKQQAQTMRSWIEGPAVQRELARALRTQIRPEVVARIVISAMVRQPALFECTRESLWASILRSLEIGLIPDGIEAALVPYKTVCTFQPMYQGLVKLASNAGATVLPPVIVYANEPFKIQLGSNPPFLHTPLPPSQRGEAVGAYGVCMVNDFPVGDFMWLEEINAVRDKSNGYQVAKRYGKDSPWTTHPAEMQKKTVFKRLCKYLPKSAELAQAVASDDEAEAGTIDTSFVVAGGGMPALPEGVIDVQPEPNAEVTPEAAEKSKAPTHDPCRDIRGEVREAIKEIGEKEAAAQVSTWEASAGCSIAECKDPEALDQLHKNLLQLKLLTANEKAKARRGGAAAPAGNGELIPGATTKTPFQG